MFGGLHDFLFYTICLASLHFALLCFALPFCIGDAAYFQYRACMDGDNLRTLEAAGIPIVRANTYFH